MRLTATVFSVLFLSQIILPAQAAFPDVPMSHPNYDAIMYAQEQNIVSGHQDGYFRGSDPITRAAFTKIIMEAAFPGQANGAFCFPDVKDEWFAAFICLAKAMDIVGGFPDGTFRPVPSIRFVEAAKIIGEAFAFSVDPDEVWYKPYVQELSNRGAIPSSIQTLDQFITRAEMAEMIHRIKEDITHKPQSSFRDNALVSSEASSNSILRQELETAYLRFLSMIQTATFDEFKNAVYDDGSRQLHNVPTAEEWELARGFLADAYLAPGDMKYLKSRQSDDWAVLHYRVDDESDPGSLEIHSIYFKDVDGTWKMAPTYRVTGILVGPTEEEKQRKIAQEFRDNDRFLLPNEEEAKNSIYENKDLHEQIEEDYDVFEFSKDKNPQYATAYQFLDIASYYLYYFEDGHVTIVKRDFELGEDNHWDYTGNFASVTAPYDGSPDDLYLWVYNRITTAEDGDILKFEADGLEY